MIEKIVQDFDLPVKVSKESYVCYAEYPIWNFSTDIIKGVTGCPLCVAVNEQPTEKASLDIINEKKAEIKARLKLKDY